jgi:hypothetical protein
MESGCQGLLGTINERVDEGLEVLVAASCGIDDTLK